MSQNIVTGQEAVVLEACLEEARVHMVKGEYEAAQSALRQALALNPTRAATLNLSGVALELQGRLGEAARYYRAALAFQPDCVEAGANLVRVTCWRYQSDGIERNLEPPKRSAE